MRLEKEHRDRLPSREIGRTIDVQEITTRRAGTSATTEQCLYQGSADNLEPVDIRLTIMIFVDERYPVLEESAEHTEDGCVGGTVCKAFNLRP